MKIAHQELGTVGQLQAELKAVLSGARWLKLACAALLVVDVIALFALWLTR